MMFFCSKRHRGEKYPHVWDCLREFLLEGDEGGKAEANEKLRNAVYAEHKEELKKKDKEIAQNEHLVKTIALMELLHKDMLLKVADAQGKKDHQKEVEIARLNTLVEEMQA